jgi:hypothetical protein
MTAKIQEEINARRDGPKTAALEAFAVPFVELDELELDEDAPNKGFIVTVELLAH